MPSFSTTQKAVIALIIANLIWGAAAPIFKWSLISTPPFTLAFLRFGLGALFLLPFLKGNFHVDKKDYLNLIILSILGVTVNISFFFLGLQYSESINAPIIGSSGPIFIILFGALFLKDHIKKRTILGSIVGLIGVLVIVVLPSIEKGLDTSLLGNVFFVLAMFSAVIHTVMIKKIIPGYNPMTIIFWMFAIGTIGFLPMFFNEIGTIGFLPAINIQVIIGIIFGVIFASVLANIFQIWAIKKMPVEDVGLFTYMDPIVAILIAFPLLGEVPTIHFFVGSILVFLGIYIAERRIHWHPLHKLRG